MKTRKSNLPRKVKRETNRLLTLPEEKDISGRSETDRFVHPLRLRSILVPIDFSAESSRALKYALSFAQEFEAKITLLHVVEPIPCPTDFGYGWVNLYRPNAELFKKAKRQIGAWRRKVGVKWLGKAIVSSGTPSQEIIHAAKELSMDLIVLSTHAEVGMSHVVLGNTAERVVRHAPCPVLVLRNKVTERNTNN